MFDWIPRPRVDLTPLRYTTASASDVFRVAVGVSAGCKSLIRSRFPFYSVHREGDGWRVLIGDARYTVDPEGAWASTGVHVEEEEAVERARR
jgi:uncharacterized protein YhdP